MAPGWQAGAAMAYASIRDFGAARECLAAARRLGVDVWYIDACEAQVLCFAGDWEGAWAAALPAIDARPGYYLSLAALRAAGFRTGRLEEAAALALRGAESNQSWESSAERHRFLCLAAERFPDLEASENFPLRGDWAERAATEAPLADGDTAVLLEYMRADERIVRGDYTGLSALPETVPHPFISAIKRRAAACPEAGRLILPHRPLTQGWNECLPTSVAVALGAVGLEIDPKAFAAAVTGAGTGLLDARDWLRGLGVESLFFSVAPATARALIRAGAPFVVAMQNDMISHAYAAVGLDEAADLLILHDPAGERYDYVLLEGDDEPFGSDAIGMAFVASDAPDPRPHLPESGRAEAWLEFWRTWQAAGLKEAKAFLESHGPAEGTDWGLRARAALAAASGEAAKAIGWMEELRKARPGCPVIKKELFECLLAIGDAKRAMETARGLLSESRSPGRELSQPWDYVPPAVMVCCAEYISRSEPAPAPLATAALHECIARAPLFAPAYAAMARIRMTKGSIAAAALPARIAAALAPENPQIAWVAAEALLRNSGWRDASVWLERSCRQILGKKDLAQMCFAARDFCSTASLPDIAESFSRMAVEGWPDDPLVLSERASALAAEGDLAGADALAARLSIGMGGGAGDPGARIHALRTAVRLARARGGLTAAKALLEEWNKAEPLQAEALTRLLEVEEWIAGPEAALNSAHRRYTAYPMDEGVRNALYYLILRLRGQEAGLAFLREALDRDPWDAWIMREIGLTEMARAQTLPTRQRSQAIESAAAYLAASLSIDPTAPANGFLAAALAQARGAMEEAVGHITAVIAQNPWNASIVAQAGTFMNGLGMEKRELFISSIEKALGQVATPAAARAAATLAVRFVGLLPGLQVYERMLGPLRGDDPACMEFLLAECPMILPAEAELGPIIDGQAAFGNSSSLVLRAKLLQSLGRSEAAVQLLFERLRSAPADHSARAAAVGILAPLGRLEEALAILDDFIAFAFPEPWAWSSMVRAAMGAGLQREALGLVREALAHYPLEPALLYALEDLGQAHFSAAETLTACQAAEAAFGNPDIALIRLRSRLKLEADPKGVEEECRNGLAERPGHAGTADLMASLLASRGAYAEAASILDTPFPPKSACVARGRRALILHMQGKSAEALSGLADVLIAYPEYDWGWLVLGSIMSQTEAKTDTFLSALSGILERFPQRALALAAAIEARGPLPDPLAAAIAKAVRGLPHAPGLIHTALRRGAIQGMEAARVEAALIESYPSHPASLARRFAAAEDRVEAARALEAYWDLGGPARAEIDPWLWGLSGQASIAERLAAACLERLIQGRADPDTIRSMLASQQASAFLLEAARNTGGSSDGQGIAGLIGLCPQGTRGQAAACAILQCLPGRGEAARAVERALSGLDRFPPGSEARARQIECALDSGNVKAAAELSADWEPARGMGAWTGWYALRARCGTEWPIADTDAAIRTAEAALDILEPDGSLPAIALRLAVAYLESGRADDFLRLARERDVLFSRARDDYWLPEDMEWARGFFPKAAAKLAASGECSLLAAEMESVAAAALAKGGKTVDKASLSEGRSLKGRFGKRLARDQTYSRNSQSVPWPVFLVIFFFISFIVRNCVHG
jgi:tetratricopeptide (TPR) repeat protein